MMQPADPQAESPFTAGHRGAGILLHVTSLPSPYGIGDMGPSATAWIDRLAAARQSWWQFLPLGPTGLGNSPYEPLSTFAGNPLLISPDRLVEDGLLDPLDRSAFRFPGNVVAYDDVKAFKDELLLRVWNDFPRRSTPALRDSFAAFCSQQAYWLDEYALFSALKERFQYTAYLHWPRELVHREPTALAKAASELAEAMNRHRFGQFLFFRQWLGLKRYANARGIRLLGDLPFFVSPDSADVWAHPELFLLDDDRRPRVVAGVPPDYFSDEGQLWGNPIYNWDAMRRDGYGWWLNRVRALLAQVDLIRLDHFRAFVSAWHIPAGSQTAQIGQWHPGPGSDFFARAREALGRLPFVAEDLGMITDDVRVLRDQFELPGMRVLQFAFDGDPRNPFLPANYITNTLACTGTHDNNTTRGWYESLDDRARGVVWQVLQEDEVASQDVCWKFIRLVWQSAAALVIAPLQDVANLGAGARMNIPGEPAGNWIWRIPPEMELDGDFDRLRELTDQRKSGS
jgi:4-alpha-glucanotransferase